MKVDKIYSAAVGEVISENVGESRIGAYKAETQKSPLSLPSFFDTVGYRYPFIKRPKVKSTTCKASSSPSGTNASSQLKYHKIYDNKS